MGEKYLCPQFGQFVDNAVTNAKQDEIPEITIEDIKRYPYNWEFFRSTKTPTIKAGINATIPAESNNLLFSRYI